MVLLKNGRAAQYGGWRSSLNLGRAEREKLPRPVWKQGGLAPRTLDAVCARTAVALRGINRRELSGNVHVKTRPRAHTSKRHALLTPSSIRFGTETGCCAGARCRAAAAPASATPLAHWLTRQEERLRSRRAHTPPGEPVQLWVARTDASVPRRGLGVA